MATNTIVAFPWGFEVLKEPSEVRESTGWRQRLKQRLHSIFEGHGENFFDGY